VCYFHVLHCSNKLRIHIKRPQYVYTGGEKRKREKERGKEASHLIFFTIMEVLRE